MYVNAQIPLFEKLSDSATAIFHDKSCEFLKNHKLVPNPVNYLVAYVHVTEKNDELSTAIAALENDGTRLDRFRIKVLFEQHLMSSAEAQCEAMFYQADSMMSQTITKLGSAGSGLNDFDSVVSEQKSRLRSANNPEDIAKVAQTLVNATEKAQLQTRELQSDLEDVQQEAVVLREELERLKHESQTDGLTGLLNRKALEQTLQDLDHQPDDIEEPCCDYSILMLDIDHFKGINDNYGHVLGDQVIKKVAQTIKNGVRGNDMVARYGGEEYLVLLPDTPAAGARVVAESIRSAIEKLRLVEKKSERKIPPFTISVGTATRKADEFSEDVIERADRCLYFSKRNGRNRYTTDEMLEAAASAEDTALSDSGLQASADNI